MKQAEYKSLVQKRKACRLCTELTNPSDPSIARHDSDEIGPWTRWHGSLTAEIMVVGQDWGDVRYFVSHEGVDQAAGNPTNENLAKLLGDIGYSVGTPGKPEPTDRLFFTNLVLCLKSGGLQGHVKPVWFKNCGSEFFERLLHLVQPYVVVALGAHPTRSILRLFNSSAVGRPLADLVADGPYELEGSDSVLFPVFHCGAWGVNKNRPFEEQQKDWARIGNWVRSRAHRPA